MTKKTLSVALLLAAVTITIGLQPAYAQVTGHATIVPATCGLNFANLNVNFGALKDGQTSFGSHLNATYTNNGNTNGTYYISGNNWLPVNTMYANATHFSSSPITTLSEYNAASALSTTNQQVTTNMPPTQSDTTFLGLLVTLIDDLFEGNAQQTITFTTECVV